MLEVGSKAPAFTLVDKAGESHSLSDFSGKTVVLYFYPKDDTPGCTIEACEFNDSGPEFSRKDAVVIGVSKDSPESHAAFEKKYGLKFLLLSDPDHKVLDAYGSWGERKFMGKKFFGTLRNTYVIGPDGRVKAAFEGVTPKGHAAQVLEAIG